MEKLTPVEEAMNIVNGKDYDKTKHSDFKYGNTAVVVSHLIEVNRLKLYNYKDIKNRKDTISFAIDDVIGLLDYVVNTRFIEYPEEALDNLLICQLINYNGEGSYSSPEVERIIKESNIAAVSDFAEAFGYCIVVSNAYISTREYPPEKYYIKKDFLFDSEIDTNGKTEITPEMMFNIIDDNSKLLSKFGFASINYYSKNEYSSTMICYGGCGYLAITAALIGYTDSPMSKIITSLADSGIGFFIIKDNGFIALRISRNNTNLFKCNIEEPPCVDLIFTVTGELKEFKITSCPCLSTI